MSEATEPPRWVCSSARPSSNIAPSLFGASSEAHLQPLEWPLCRPDPNASRACPSSTSSRFSPRRRCGAAKGGRRSSISAAATPTSARRRTSSRRSPAAPRATRRARLLADPRPPRDEGGDRHALPRRLRRRARPRARGRARPRDEDGDRRARARARRRRRHDPAARPVLPRLPLGRRARRRPARHRSARSRRRLGTRPRRRSSGGGALPQLPVEPVRGLRAAGNVRGRRRWAARTGGDVVHDAAYVDLVFDGRTAPELPRDAGAKDVGVEMWTMSKTYGMAGWRIGFVLGNAEVVERINLFNDHSRVGIFAPLQARPSLRSKARRTRSPSASPLRARRDRLAAALPVPIVCEGTFYVWLRLPDGLTADRLLEEHASRSRPARASGRAAPAGCGCRSPSTTRRSSSPPSVSRTPSQVRPHEDRHRRPVLVVVLGRRRRALRAPGGCAPPTRSRREDPDGQRPAGRLTRLLHPRTRPARRAPRRDHPGRPLGRRARRTGRCRTSSCRRRSIGRIRRVLVEEQFDVVHLHEPMTPAICVAALSFADCPIVATQHAPGELGWLRCGHPLLGLPHRPGRRADRRLADGGRVGVPVAPGRLPHHPERCADPRSRRARRTVTTPSSSSAATIRARGCPRCCARGRTSTPRPARGSG